MRWLWSVCAVGLTALPIVALSADPVIEMRADGTLSIQGNAEIPLYDDGGRWDDHDTKSTSRFTSRHFLFTVPGQPPALELFIITDRTNEAPDGIFEASMIRGYLATFSRGIGFRYDDPVFADAIIGSEHARTCRVELTDGNRKIWLYAYSYLRRPSLVFLTVRPRGDANQSIENYLAKVRLQ